MWSSPEVEQHCCSPFLTWTVTLALDFEDCIARNWNDKILNAKSTPCREYLRSHSYFVYAMCASNRITLVLLAPDLQQVDIAIRYT